MPSAARFDNALIKAIRHPLRVRILELLDCADATPVGLSEDLEVTHGVVRYHSDVLLECGCIEAVGMSSRGKVLRAVPRSFIGHQDWRNLPRSLRGNVTALSLQAFVERAMASLEAGTIDQRDDTTFTWMTLAFDEVGWVQVHELMGGIGLQLEALSAQSHQRLRMTDNDAVPVIVGLAAFELGGQMPGAQQIQPD